MLYDLTYRKGSFTESARAVKHISQEAPKAGQIILAYDEEVQQWAIAVCVVSKGIMGFERTMVNFNASEDEKYMTYGMTVGYWIEIFDLPIPPGKNTNPAIQVLAPLKI